MIEDLYYSKYLKYKNKYMQLKALIGGTDKNTDGQFEYTQHYDMNKFLAKMTTQIQQLELEKNNLQKNEYDSNGRYTGKSKQPEQIIQVYQNLEEMEKLLKYWIKKHEEQPISVLVEQLKPFLSTSADPFLIIKTIFNEICSIYVNPYDEKEYKKKYLKKSYKDLRELAVRIYRTIHPEIVKKEHEDDAKGIKGYRIGNGFPCEHLPNIPY
jgi:hypothetical protein